jgi:beta-aspartyl-dipeptidase (metallo-type)
VSWFLQEGIVLLDVVMGFTQAPAYALGLDHCKGRIAVGMSADLLVLDDNLMLKHTFARGRCMVRDSEAIVRGTFEA